MVAELTADRLTAAQILASVRPLEFFHPLIGAAVREEIAPGARRVAHRRAAGLVDDGDEGSQARVAAHLLASGPAGDGWVVQRLRDAAREALDRGAPEVAAGYVRRALSEPPSADDRAALLFSLGTAEWRAGQPDAIAHLEQALAAAGDDPRTLIAASSALTLAYAESDRAERAVEVAEQALAAVGDRNATLALTERLGAIEPEPLRDARLALMVEAAIALVGRMNEHTAPAALRRAEDLLGRLNVLTGPPVYLLVMLAYYAARTNRAAEARELAERALACKPYPPPLDVCIVLIVTRTLVESYDELDRLSDDVLAAARRRQRDARDDRDPRMPGDGVVRPWRGGGRALGAGRREGGPPDARGQRGDLGADRARRARGGRGRARPTCRSNPRSDQSLPRTPRPKAGRSRPADSTPRACVIGAGPSGVAAAKALVDRGISFDWFEKGSMVCGLWRIDNDNGGAAAYETLCLNSSRKGAPMRRYSTSRRLGE